MPGGGVYGHGAAAGGADSVARDSTRARQLPEINVTVTRSPEPLQRVPYAVGVLDKSELQRGQLTVGLDEALNNLPGVVVANRYNFSLDQRISIRGFGSRSNFGVRGLKILLDGVPQTLPDGQSQLTNIDFANLERAEVLRGASSSLYGNASGGVVSFQSQQAAPGPFAQRVRVQGGDGKRDGDGFYKWQSWTSGRSGNVSGTLSISQFKADGFRQHSAAEFRQLNGGVDYAVSGLYARHLAAGPRRRSPSPESRRADVRRIFRQSRFCRGQQHPAGRGQRRPTAAALLGIRHYDAQGNEYEATIFGLLRNLVNPLAAPPPVGASPTAGTFVTIDRAVGGARVGAARRLGVSETAPRLTAGADLQRMRDNRENRVSDGGLPSGALFLDQREQVTEFGPFAQIQWTPDKRLLLSGGARYDWVRFDLADRFIADGDDSGARTMSALSGNIGASWSFGSSSSPTPTSPPHSKRLRPPSWSTSPTAPAASIPLLGLSAR